VFNLGSDVSEVSGSQYKQKLGLKLVNRENAATAAIVITSVTNPWHKGLYCEQRDIGSGSDDAFVQLKDNASPQKTLFQITRDGLVDLNEQSSTPAAPSANKARIFARDNGSGKTQLCVLFNTGAVQVIATEP